MAYRIKWTPKSVDTLENCFDFISITWTKREINQLKSAINKNLKRLKIHPYSSPNSHLFPDVRMAHIKSYIVLIFRVNESKKQVELTAFFDTRQNPSKLKLK